MQVGFSSVFVLFVQIEFPEFIWNATEIPNDDDDFEVRTISWVGKPTKKDRKLYFEAVSLGGEEYKINDDVRIRSDVPNRFFIGRICSLWRGITTSYFWHFRTSLSWILTWLEGSKDCARVRWYYLPEETCGDIEMVAMKQELYWSEHFDTVFLGTFVNKVKIVDRVEDLPMKGICDVEFVHMCQTRMYFFVSINFSQTRRISLLSKKRRKSEIEKPQTPPKVQKSKRGNEGRKFCSI